MAMLQHEATQADRDLCLYQVTSFVVTRLVQIFNRNERSKTCDSPKRIAYDTLSHDHFPPQTCKPERLGEGSKLGKSPKMVRRGCKRSFGPTAQRSPKSHLHHVQPCFAPVQPGVAPAQEAFRSLGPRFKRPFAPSPNHFRGFP